MKRRLKEFAGLLLLILGVFAIATLLVGSAKYLQSVQPFRVALPFSPKPPLLSEESNFPCLDAQSQLKAKKRFAVLHGPDWKIDSLINPKCLPERELVFSTEEGKHFLPRPVTRRITFWITKKDDLIRVKIWGNTPGDQLTTIAIELVTNHRCKRSSSKNCVVQSTWRNPQSE